MAYNYILFAVAVKFLSSTQNSVIFSYHFTGFTEQNRIKPEKVESLEAKQNSVLRNFRLSSYNYMPYLESYFCMAFLSSFNYVAYISIVKIIPLIIIFLP